MKSVLLAKSNIRKNKGLSICILLLITIASMFICLSFILSNDYSKNANKEAKRLNTSNGYYNTNGNQLYAQAGNSAYTEDSVCAYNVV